MAGQLQLRESKYGRSIGKSREERCHIEERGLQEVVLNKNPQEETSGARGDSFSWAGLVARGGELASSCWGVK